MATANWHEQEAKRRGCI
uniref:Uncharacterized protein n=1 Tax=Zea mays TaxID=4577 RepID=C4J5S6_MAIZE|nr:unknown [Zea mays]